MFCGKCGKEVNEGDLVCGNCGNRLEESNPVVENETVTKSEKAVENKPTMERATMNVETDAEASTRRWKAVVRLGVYILAIVIVVMFFSAAGTIDKAAGEMIRLRSVGGKTVAEAYYQYYGTFLSGLVGVVQALGITCGVITGYIGSKIK